MFSADLFVWDRTDRSLLPAQSGSAPSAASGLTLVRPGSSFARPDARFGSSAIVASFRVRRCGNGPASVGYRRCRPLRGHGFVGTGTGLHPGRTRKAWRCWSDQHQRQQCKQTRSAHFYLPRFLSRPILNGPHMDEFGKEATSVTGHGDVSAAGIPAGQRQLTECGELSAGRSNARAGRWCALCIGSSYCKAV